MNITAHTAQENETSVTIDVTIDYASDLNQFDTSRLFRVHLDKITGRFSIFHEGQVGHTSMEFINIENPDEQEERAILACIHFPTSSTN